MPRPKRRAGELCLLGRLPSSSAVPEHSLLHTTRSHARHFGLPILATALLVSAGCRPERGPEISTNFTYEVEGALMIVEGRDAIEVIPEYEQSK